MLESWDHEHWSRLPDHREPWTDDDVVCPRCRYRWRAVRTLATDIDDLECPACRSIGAELVGDINVAELTRQ